MGCQVGVETTKLTIVMNDKKTESAKSYDTIKLGIDAHSKWYYMARQLDSATPQPVQKMELDGLLHFVANQQKLAGEVHTCYEAGAFGYYLHRKLAAMGVSNLVVQPQDWDERGKGVKTDRIDALALCQRLDRYVRGNRKAFSVVRVPIRRAGACHQPAARATGARTAAASGDGPQLVGDARDPCHREVVDRQDLGHDPKRCASVGAGATENLHQVDRTGGGRGTQADRTGPGSGAGPEGSEGSRGAEFRSLAPGGW